MLALVAISFACIVMASAVLTVSTMRKNHSIGKTAGFPTYYSPAHVGDIWWLLLHKSLVPWFHFLPTSWTQPWSSLIQIWDIWKIGTAPYEAAGSDTLTFATPRENMLWTCDAAITQQIFQQHGSTVLPTDMVKFFEIWGPSISTVEGEEWKKHRRIVTAGFNPSTNAAVWKETLRQTKLLVERVQGEGSVIKVMKEWTLRFTLNVLSAVLFDHPSDFDKYSQDEDKHGVGSSMTFQKALITVISELTSIVSIPKFVLRNAPFAKLKKAALAFDTLTKHLNELHHGAVSGIETARDKKYNTVLESLVLAATQEGAKKGDQPLAAEDVFGNMFLMLLAGHETTGNTLAFILLLLAIYPKYQLQIQADVDKQLGGRPQNEWSVESDFAPLQAGIIGAVQKETLRLYQINQFLWRRAAAPTTVVDSQGVSHVIPAGTLCCSSWSVTPKDARVWSERKISPERRRELSNSPALYFDPTRWLRDEAVSQKEVVPESYFPFGIGARSCPGRLFATVEMTVFMAAMFSEYSLELVVSEKMVKECGGDRSKAWDKTRDNAIRMLYDDISSVINIELLKELPVKLVKRSVPGMANHEGASLVR